ncbi:HNH endonuclease [bacterium]|nr:HNH endonuclease [bacterium]
MNDLPKRFWDKVNKDVDGGCWEWLAHLNKHGYGIFALDGPKLAHRLVMGAPDNLVLHKCDNPKCVNPEHLYIGNARDNMIDRAVRGNPDGIKHKLTPEKVVEIRSYIEQGCTQTSIAVFMGVNNRSISHIATGKTWAYV